MAALDEARQTLADAVTSAGLACAAYPPDNISAPGAFVDSLTASAQDPSAVFPGTFCLPLKVTAIVVTLAQRHDRAGGITSLEALVAPVLDALHAIPGLQVTGWTSGAVNVGGQDLPSVLYTVSFHA